MNNCCADVLYIQISRCRVGQQIWGRVGEFLLQLFCSSSSNATLKIISKCGGDKVREPWLHSNDNVVWCWSGHAAGSIVKKYNLISLSKEERKIWKAMIRISIRYESVKRCLPNLARLTVQRPSWYLGRRSIRNIPGLVRIFPLAWKL